MEQRGLREHIVLVDAVYADTVAAGMIRNFTPGVGRDITSADLADWLVCCALDGGLPEGDNLVQVTFVYPQDRERLTCFAPSSLLELDGQAFRDERMGEFEISCVREESISEGDPLMVQSVAFILQQHGVKTLTIIADLARYGEELTNALKGDNHHTEVMVLSMHPREDAAFRQVMLGYSMLHALGIRAEEVK